MSTPILATKRLPWMKSKGLRRALASVRWPVKPRNHRQPKRLLTVLINEIATIPDGFVLVLDDYHCPRRLHVG